MLIKILYINISLYLSVSKTKALSLLKMNFTNVRVVKLSETLNFHIIRNIHGQSRKQGICIIIKYNIYLHQNGDSIGLTLRRRFLIL